MGVAQGYNRGQDAPLCDLELYLAMLGWELDLAKTNSRVKTSRCWRSPTLRVYYANGSPHWPLYPRSKWIKVTLRRDGTQKRPWVQSQHVSIRACSIEKLIEKGVIDVSCD